MLSLLSKSSLGGLSEWTISFLVLVTYMRNKTEFGTCSKTDFTKVVWVLSHVLSHCAHKRFRQQNQRWSQNFLSLIGKPGCIRGCLLSITIQNSVRFNSHVCRIIQTLCSWSGKNVKALQVISMALSLILMALSFCLSFLLVLRIALFCSTFDCMTLQIFQSASTTSILTKECTERKFSMNPCSLITRLLQCLTIISISTGFPTIPGIQFIQTLFNILWQCLQLFQQSKSTKQLIIFFFLSLFIYILFFYIFFFTFVKENFNFLYRYCCNRRSSNWIAFARLCFIT